MLGFIARRAVRAALRPVVHAAVGAAVTNHKARQEALAWQQHQHAMQQPWWLLPSATGDSGLYFDRRSYFSQSLPGWPRMIAATGAPGEPPCDQHVALQELPISVRYRLTSVAPGHSASANARAIAEGHIAQTTGAAQPIADTADYQRQHWRVEGAVSASYRLPGADAYGADTEELLVLVRQGASMQVTTRYPGASLDWLRLALFRSVSLPGLVWDASAPAVAREVWPPSTFLAPGLGGDLVPVREQMLPQLVPQLGMPPPEREALSTQLGALITREEPPWAPMPPAALAGAGEALARATSNPRVHAIVRQALGEVRTAHDLRGMAIWLGRALELASQGP